MSARIIHAVFAFIKGKNMLNLNGKRFARNSAELVSTLFQSGGTACGTYKRNKNGTRLYRTNGELFAYIVHNPKQGYFAVSAGITTDGKPFYMQALCKSDKWTLGFNVVSDSVQSEIIRAAFSN
jgi:hypothetical protein